MLIVIRSLFLVLKIILSSHVGFKEEIKFYSLKCDVFVLNFSFLNCNKRGTKTYN